MQTTPPQAIALGLSAVIIAVTDEEPRVVTVQWSEGIEALPFGLLDPDGHDTLSLALCDWVREQTGLELGYVEQLYTFGDRFRDPRERRDQPRAISVAYVALVRQTRLVGRNGARWRAWYDFFPWEDWRDGRPSIIPQRIEPALQTWVDAAPNIEQAKRRKERADITFGLSGVRWDEYRSLERYELLYEVGIVAEAARDRRGLTQDPPGVVFPDIGRSTALDHRRILATALSRIRGKIKFRPVIFDLLPEHFTLLQLQRVVEALAGVRLHKQNFRRLVDRGGLVESTGLTEKKTGGRPAALFRFRRDVLREHHEPGVGLPISRTP